MEPSKFERAVFEWIAVHVEDPALESQLRDVEIIKREYTGVGCYSEIGVLKNAHVTEGPLASGGPLSGPNFESPAVEYGGGTLLWFSEGVVNLLEIFSYGADFPKCHSELGDFSLERDKV